MKRILLLMLLCISSTIAIAQTTWTGLGADTNWNTTDNWDTNLVPTAADDVIIPTGFTVTLNVAGTVKSIDLQGTSVFDMNTNLIFTEPSTFGVNVTVNWTSGIINGTTSTLTNLGAINISTTANNSINGGTTLDNQGTLTITGSGDLFVNQASVINNPIGGDIDMQADAGNISFNVGPAGVLNNEGVIKKTTSVGQAVIVIPINNNDGIIQVEAGTLSFQTDNGKNFTDGTYNVFVGASMDWDTTINPSGTLEGTIIGDLNWNNTLNVPTGQTVFLNFLETDNFNWKGVLSGGGTLTNTNILNFAGTYNSSINGGTTLDNQGIINFTGSGDLFINQDSVVNNPIGSIIDMQTDAGNISFNIGPAGVINNAGLIKKTNSVGQAVIVIPINNNDGTIQAEAGILSFQGTGKNFTDGTYNVFVGATMDWDTTINPSGTIEGTVVGDLNWNNTLNVPTGETVFLNFLETDNFNWKGVLSGGGTLTNTNILNFAGTYNSSINGGTTLDNQGTINFTGSGDLFINQDSVVNNPIGSVIDMQTDGGNINFNIGPAGVLNNEGLIKKTTSAGQAVIVTPINNIDGTIQVEVGTLSFQTNNGKNFTDGMYNVFAGASMNWDTVINPSGTLEGTIVGDLNWNNTVNVVDGTFAAINFSETDNFNWKGILSGGGTLTNSNVLNFAGTNNSSINGVTTLDNQGTINFTGSGDLFINQDSVLNNSNSGVIDMQTDAGNISFNVGPAGVFNNAGFVTRTTSIGLVQITVELNNSGTIEVASGELEHTGSNPFTNEVTGIVKGIGVFDLPTVANYINNGTFAPGLSPGTLSVQGDYISTATSVLDIELDGLTPDTEYDVLAINGTNNVFEGSVGITMGFDGTIGDVFTIATTSGTIATANLQSPIENVDFEGKRYTFDVSYPDNNKVMLTISDKLDIQVPDVITQNITVQLDASGNASITTAQIDNGSTDNCTIVPNLVYGLDVSSFTCADLGVKTVNLTVTDEANNSASLPATVTVVDSVNPTVVTQNITVQLDASGNAGITTGDIDNGSSDNCTVTSLALDVTTFTCTNLGTNTVNLTVTDQSSNSASAAATVTVVDPVNPTVVTQNITVQLDASGNGSITTGDIDNGSSDNCSVASLALDVTTFTCTNLGTNTVNLTVTDQSSNSASAAATVTVVDSVIPTVVTQNITLQLDASGNGSIATGDIDNGSSDNCSVANFVLDVTAFTCADLGANTVNLTVTDQSTNSASASAIVTLEDIINPSIVCPANFTVQSMGDFILPDYYGNGTVTASDNCNVASVVQTPVEGTVLPDGFHNIDYLVTDSSGNTEICMFQLKVEDSTLSVEDYILSENDILIFPNPVVNKVILRNSNKLQLIEALLIDFKGSVIKTIDLKGMTSDREISLEDFASGMYFIKINSINGSVVKRLIKQ